MLNCDFLSVFCFTAHRMLSAIWPTVKKNIYPCVVGEGLRSTELSNPWVRGLLQCHSVYNWKWDLCHKLWQLDSFKVTSLSLGAAAPTSDRVDKWNTLSMTLSISQVEKPHHTSSSEDPTERFTVPVVCASVNVLRATLLFLPDWLLVLRDPRNREKNIWI